MPNSYVPKIEYMYSAPTPAPASPEVVPYTPPNQPNYDPQVNLPFDTTGPEPSLAEGYDPRMYEQHKQDAQKLFYKEFATKFHKQSFKNLDEYQRWVDTLPYTANPELRGYVNETALKYMPKKLKMQYAAQEADAVSATKASQLFKQQMDMAEQLKRMQAEGTIPKNYYLDQGKIKYNTRMLPGSGDKQKIIYQQMRDADKEIEDALTDFEKQKAKIKKSLLYQEWETMIKNNDPEQAQAQQTNPNMVDTGGEDLQDLTDAIEYAKANPNDPKAQAIGQDAVERLQALQQ